MKPSPTFKVTLCIFALMLYFALAILGFESAKAEVPVADKMLSIAACIAAESYVSEVMQTSGKPTLALVFSQEADRYIALWQLEFPDLNWGPFAISAWDQIVDMLRRGTRDYKDVLDFAKSCSLAWEE